MASDPSIERATPRGAVTRPEQGIPVLARIHWLAEARDDHVPAIATAWTRDAVEATWNGPEGLRSDWLPAGYISREPRDVTNRFRVAGPSA